MTVAQPVWANSRQNAVFSPRENSSPAPRTRLLRPPARLDLPAWRFFRGYCTWYVATKRRITWRGNAAQWAINAAKQGYWVGKTPRKGAIYVSTRESSRGCRTCGHVAYVEKVEKNRFLVSEMNYRVWNTISHRWVNGKTGTFIY